MLTGLRDEARAIALTDLMTTETALASDDEKGSCPAQQFSKPVRHEMQIRAEDGNVLGQTKRRALVRGPRVRRIVGAGSVLDAGGCGFPTKDRRGRPPGLLFIEGRADDTIHSRGRELAPS